MSNRIVIQIGGQNGGGGGGFDNNQNNGFGNNNGGFNNNQNNGFGNNNNGGFNNNNNGFGNNNGGFNNNNGGFGGNQNNFNNNNGGFNQNQGFHNNAPQVNQPQNFNNSPGFNNQPQPNQQTNPNKLTETKYSNDGFGRLAKRNGIFIKQTVSACEMLTCCNLENTYVIYPLGKDGEDAGKLLFKAHEESGCFARQCLSQACRAFKVTVNIVDNEDAPGVPFLLLNRPCTCTVGCCNSPEISVSYVEDGKDIYLGKIVEPCDCCSLVLKILDKDNGHLYSIDGSRCQTGLCCKGPMECCQNVEFNVKTPAGDTCTGIKKKSPGCCTSLMTTADNFTVHFPAEASHEVKALILGATLYMDFRYFEGK